MENQIKLNYNYRIDGNESIKPLKAATTSNLYQGFLDTNERLLSKNKDVKLVLQFLIDDPLCRKNDEWLWTCICIKKGYARDSGDTFVFSKKAILNRRVIFASIERARRLIQSSNKKVTDQKTQVMRKQLQVKATVTYGESVAYISYEKI